MVTGRTLVHALVGALVGVVLSFIPFSTVIGGAVAGFLEGPDSRDGTVAGALAGAITFVPILVGVFLIAAVLGIGVSVAAIPLEGGALALVVMGFLSMAVLLYTVGLALLGGYLGAYLAAQYPQKHAQTHRSIGGTRYESVGRTRPHPPRDSPQSRPEYASRRDAMSRDRSPHSSASHAGEDDVGEFDDRHGSDTFRPDPNDRHDPTRWHDAHESASDSDSEASADADAGTHDERETERESDRE